MQLGINRMQPWELSALGVRRGAHLRRLRAVPQCVAGADLIAILLAIDDRIVVFWKVVVVVRAHTPL
jgi:hypothetical protein